MKKIATYLAIALAVIFAIVLYSKASSIPSGIDTPESAPAQADKSTPPPKRPTIAVAPRATDPAYGEAPRCGEGWCMPGYTDLRFVREGAADLMYVHPDKLGAWAPVKDAMYDREQKIDDAHRNCGFKHMMKMDMRRPCAFNMELVITREPGDGENGRIRYAQIAPSSSKNPIFPEMSPMCRKYAECVVRTGQIGREFPVPTDKDGSIDHYSLIAGTIKNGQEQSYGQYLRGMHNTLARALEDIKHIDEGTPEYDRAQNAIDYYNHVIEELQDEN